MDLVLRSGDQATFNPAFGAALVVAPPGIITGTGRSKIDGIAVCVSGDESSVVVTGTYTAGAFATPGTGVLTIASLGADQIAKGGSAGRVPMLLRGGTFQARFQVATPAANPNSGVPDPSPTYMGTGTFSTTNTRLKVV